LPYPSGKASEALYRKHSERCHIDNGNRKPIGKPLCPRSSEPDIDDRLPPADSGVPRQNVRRLERIENPKPRPGSPEPVFRGGVRLRTRLGRDHGDRFARILPETPMSEKAVSQFSEKIGK